MTSKICLTPTRNERWIIDTFLSAAKTWADRIIIADQRSNDGTRERLTQDAAVTLVDNDQAALRDNAPRQRLLLNESRRIPGKRIVFGLDADEALSSNHTNSADWERIEKAPPGTVLRFRWVNLLPGLNQAWIPPGYRAFGFVDDGSPHEGSRTHSPRVPQPKGAPTLDLDDIVVLHFQFLAWERMESKHRWYQAWERVENPSRSLLDIYREYNHMKGSWEESELKPVRAEWLTGYADLGIDFQKVESETITWWDREVLGMIQQKGSSYFRKLNIWDADWETIAASVGNSGGDLRDPRSLFEKGAHTILRSTQGCRGNLAVRAFESLLRRCGW